MYTNVHNSIICYSQDLEAIQVPINRWIDKEYEKIKYISHIYTNKMEYY